MQRLSEVVPWLEPVLYWLIAISTVWLLASMLAALLRRATGPLSEAIRQWADGMRDAVKRWRAAARDGIAQAKRKLFDESAERPLDHAVREQWLQDAGLFREPLIEATRAFTVARDRNDEAVKAVTATSGLLQRVVSTSVLPAIPSASVAAEAERSRATSILNLFLALLLLLPIIFANALLTALVFRAVLGSMQGVFAGIPPAYALAVVVTLGEAALGVAHGVLSAEARNTGRHYTPGVLVVAFLAMVAVFVEFLFYSQFADTGAQQLTLPLLDMTVPPGTPFSLLGLLLGSSVVILGRIVYVSGNSVLQQGSLKRTRRRYESLARTLEEIHSGIETRKTTIGDLQHLTTDLHRQLQDRRLHLATEEFSARASSFLSSEPAWVKPSRRPLNASEMESVDSDSILSSVVALIGMAAMVSLGRFSLLSAIPGVSAASASVLAVIPAVATFYAGYLFSQRLRDRTAHFVALIGTVLLTVVLGMGTGYLVGVFAGWTTQLMVGVGVLIAGALLFASGASLAGKVSLVLLNARAVLIHVMSLLLFLFCLLCYLLWLVVAVVDTAIGVLAYPVTIAIQALSRRRLAQ